jgi:hypothetical protein
MLWKLIKSEQKGGPAPHADAAAEGTSPAGELLLHEAGGAIAEEESDADVEGDDGIFDWFDFVYLFHVALRLPAALQWRRTPFPPLSRALLPASLSCSS